MPYGHKKKVLIAIMKAKEIRKLDVLTIDQEIKNLESKVFELKNQIENRQIEDLSRLKKSRRDTARMITIRAEKLKEADKS
jgi:ribosomal protein L29